MSDQAANYMLSEYNNVPFMPTHVHWKCAWRNIVDRSIDQFGEAATRCAISNHNKLSKIDAAWGANTEPDQIATLTAEIDKLKEEKAKLLEVLRPFAKALRQLEDDMQLCDEDLDLVLAGIDIRVSDLRSAAALIKELEGEKSK